MHSLTIKVSYTKQPNITISHKTARNNNQIISRLVCIVLSLSLFACITASKCIEKKRFGLLDCSGLVIQDTNQILLESRKDWVISIDLNGNRLVLLNTTELTLAFPKLKFVDVRDNPLLDCQLVWESRITLKSDCKPSLISTPRPSSTPRLSLISTPRPSSISTPQPPSVSTPQPLQFNSATLLDLNSMALLNSTTILNFYSTIIPNFYSTGLLINSNSTTLLDFYSPAPVKKFQALVSITSHNWSLDRIHCCINLRRVCKLSALQTKNGRAPVEKS